MEISKCLINMNEEKFEKELYDLYVVKGMSTRDLAKHYGVGQTTIRRWLLNNAIEARKSNEYRNSEFYIAKAENIKNKISQTLINYNLNNGTTKLVTCPICRKEFKTSVKRPAKYCCKECYKLALENKRLEKSQMTSRCIKCGKEIKYKHKYCDECRSIAANERSKKLRNRIKTKCAYCGNELEIIPALMKSNRNHFCNVDCMSKYYSDHYSGENSPTWKGGKRHYFGNWLKMRRLALERDNFTCQLCGVKQEDWHKELDVHHIMNYREFDDKFEANKLENLICLCNKCHSFIHSNKNIEKKFIKHKI